MRDALLERLTDLGAVAVVRLTDPDQLHPVVEALCAGGVTGIEITMTVPGALGLIEETASTYGDDVLLGVGSVLDRETVHQAIDAGARFVVSPVMKPELIEAAHERGALALPGAFTPTEVQTAYEAGADVVKVFPANIVGMPFIKAVRAPMPHLRLMPTGGVTPSNAGQWLQAGACAVGIGSALLDKQALAEGRYERLTELARETVRSIQAVRA